MVKGQKQNKEKKSMVLFGLTYDKPKNYFFKFNKSFCTYLGN